MSDVPTQGAQSVHNSSSLGMNNASAPNTRDIEDIDRELEAYLEEKRSGKASGFNHTVDEQLSAIREKLNARETRAVPQREPVPAKPAPQVEQKETVTPARTPSENQAPSAPGTSMSHDDLIRSLEEKYSKGESTNVPPAAQVALAEKKPEPKATAAPTPNPAPAPAPTPVEQAEKSEVKTEKTSTPASAQLSDLRESIDSPNTSRVEELLASASTLDTNAQRELSEAFLPRFKRNKERKELYERTQLELENELSAFIEKNRKKGASALNAAPAPAPAMPTESREPKAPEPPQREVSQFDILQNQTKEAPTPPPAPRAQPVAETQVPPPAPAAPQAEVQSENLTFEAAYRTYLDGLDKKPTVLMYDPASGFVRRVVDPSDELLSLSYTADDASQSIKVTVRDIGGNELGEVTFPQGALDN